jgi:hypothetical protein
MATIFVGDRVHTPDGEGFVEEFMTWRDRILEMGDVEAREFTEQCRMENGPEFKQTWGRVLVRVSGRARRYSLQQITVIEGRDGIVR